MITTKTRQGREAVYKERTADGQEQERTSKNLTEVKEMTGSNNWEDVQDMGVRFQTEWKRLRKSYGENLVLKDLNEARQLKYDRWEEQCSHDKLTRTEAVKDILRCSFTFKVFRMLKVYKTATETTKRFFFAEWQNECFMTFGQLMGDAPRTLIAQGEWWKKEKVTDEMKVGEYGFARCDKPEPRYYTAVRNGDSVKRVTKAEEKYRTETNIEFVKPIDTDGFMRVASVFRHDGATDKGLAALSFAAACYLKPTIKDNGIAMRHFRVNGTLGGKESEAIKRMIKALFATQTELTADEVTFTRIMYHTSSSDFVPLILTGYNNARANKAIRCDIINGMRSAFNGLGTLIGQPDLSMKRYYTISPCVLFCQNPPIDRGLRWRTIQIDIPNCFENKATAVAALAEADLQAFGALLYRTALSLEKEEVGFWHNSCFKYHREGMKLGCFEAEQTADIITGLWLIRKAAQVVGVDFQDAFGEACDDIETRIINAISLDGVEM